MMRRRRDAQDPTVATGRRRAMRSAYFECVRGGEGAKTHAATKKEPDYV